MSNEKPAEHNAGFFNTLIENSTGLEYALSLQKTCAAVGFDWHTMAPVIAKVREEIDEIQYELNAKPVSQARLKDEIGDAFFALVNLARHAGIDPDDAVSAACEKFRLRFEHVAGQAKAGKGSVQQYSLEELEAFWVIAKGALASPPQYR